MFYENDKIIKTQFCSFYKNYEFYSDNYLLNPEYKKASNYTNLMYYVYKDIYFRVLDDGKLLQELITGKKFFKMDDSSDFVYRYFNKETGLSMLVISSDLNEQVDLKIMINKAYNIKYMDRIEKFFKYYEILENKDEVLVNKAHLLMLKKGINYLQK